MIELLQHGAYLVHGSEIVEDTPEAAKKLQAMLGAAAPSKEEAAKGTIAYGILEAHNTSDSMDKLKIRFDKLTSHDITYVGIIQTARASGLEKFPMPYVLTNCHNSLCAVGGTINEDDHMFGLTCAKRYGGIYVPPHQAVIHQFAREMLACGGGGSSPLWRQMLADTYNCPVRTVKSKEGPALGVAILAGVGAGLYPSVQEACDAMIQVNEPQAPILENVPQYEAFYQVYKTLYPAMQSSFKSLAQLG